MVPPVLIDMNKDGVKDILMSSFNGYMILYDGETLEVMWKIKLEERESYRLVFSIVNNRIAAKSPAL